MNDFPEAALLIDLPPVPEKFRQRLADIGTHRGKPLFRIVDGQRETTFRNGEMETKHLFHSETQNCYVKVESRIYRRKNFKTDEFHLYATLKEARRDKNTDLAYEVETGTKHHIRAIGKPCWVVEVYVAPDDIDYDTWQKERYQWLDWQGVQQKVDMLGEYPREGRYIWCFDVIDAEGNAVSPSDKTLDECRRRVKIVSGETQTTDQAIQCDINAMTRFEERTLERMNDNFLQWAGITAHVQRGGVVGRPISNIH